MKLKITKMQTKLTFHKQEVFEKITKLERVELILRKYEVDANKCSLEELLRVNYDAEKKCIENHTFENFLQSANIQAILKLNVNETHEDIVQVKRIA